MRRQDKYPDTKTFHFFNANPKNRFTGDCVVRALTVALEKPYEEILIELVKIQIRHGYDMSSPEAYSRLLSMYGWEKQKQPRKHDNTKYTGSEFCKLIAKPGKRYVANLGGNHVAAIVGCRILDTWDSTDGCIGNYWVKG